MKRNKNKKTIFNKLTTKLTHLATNEYFDLLVSAFVDMFPYIVTDEMHIPLEEAKEEKNFPLYGEYFAKHNSDYLAALDHLMTNWYFFNDSNEGIKWSDILLDEIPQHFTEKEKEIIYTLADTTISIFEVTSVNSGNSMVLKDLLLKGEYTVYEKKASSQLKVGDSLITRVVPVNDKHYLNVFGVPVLKEVKDELVEDILEAFSEYGNEYDNDLGFFLFSSSSYLLAKNRALTMSFLSSNMQIKTTTGERLRECTMEYKILDHDKLIESFKNIEEFDQTSKKSWIWFGGEIDGRFSSETTNKLFEINEKNQNSNFFQNIILGKLSIKGDILRIECSSELRLLRLDQILMEAAKDALKFKSKTIKEPDLKEIFKETQKKSSKSSSQKNTLSFEEEYEMMHEFYVNYYKTLFTKSIPALGNKSPKECLKTKEGREKVYDLLEDHRKMEMIKKEAGDIYFNIDEVYMLWGIPKRK